MNSRLDKESSMYPFMISTPRRYLSSCGLSQSSKPNEKDAKCVTSHGSILNEYHNSLKQPDNAFDIAFRLRTRKFGSLASKLESSDIPLKMLAHLNCNTSRISEVKVHIHKREEPAGYDIPYPSKASSDEN